VLRSSNRYGDVTMPITTVPVYKELDTISSSSSQTEHNASIDCLSVRWKNLKKEGRFLFHFLVIDSRSKSMPLLRFFYYLDLYLLFKIKVSRIS
jgi:hypothetical protein